MHANHTRGERARTIPLNGPQVDLVRRILASDREMWESSLASPTRRAADREGDAEALRHLAELEPLIASGALPATHGYWGLGAASSIAEWMDFRAVPAIALDHPPHERRQALADARVCLDLFEALDSLTDARA